MARENPENSPNQVNVAEGIAAKENIASNLKNYIFLTFVLSVAANLLLLVSPLYMIQVYDRVLTSGSLSTLFSLSVLAVFLLAIYAFAEGGRRRAISLYGRRRLTGQLNALSALLLSRPDPTTAETCKEEPTLQDISRVRSALNTGSILPLFDVPFTPAFLMLMFILHPLIGSIGLVGALVLVAVAILSERLTSTRFESDQAAETLANKFLSNASQSKSAIIAMGMRTRVLAHWNSLSASSQDSSLSTSALSGIMSGVSKSLRQILQALVLGCGAYLALQQQMSPGGIIAGSIIMGRALAPVDQIVGGWKQLALTRKSWKKLRNLDGAEQETIVPESVSVSQLDSGLSCKDVSVTPPGGTRPLIRPFNLDVSFGEVVVVVGPSGSGKSSLLQVLAGAWPLVDGELSLSNRRIDSWNDEDRGRFVGYLPQRTELLPGTVAENIARFGNCDDTAIEHLARNIGFHELFMSLSDGYSTKISETFATLSAGQMQAVGLARAVFGQTKLLLLDEPTANLDASLSSRFIASLQEFRKQGRATIITTHDARLLPHADRLFSTAGQRLDEIPNPTRSRQSPSVSTTAMEHSQ